MERPEFKLTHENSASNNMMKYQTVSNQSNFNQNGGEDHYLYKAMKYHMKIQMKLKQDYVNKGLSVPSGYEKYLQPFNN